jgi:flagellum-specific ATP synthase
VARDLSVLEGFAARLRDSEGLVEYWGEVRSIDSFAIGVSGLSPVAGIGDLLDVHAGSERCLAEVISVRPDLVSAKLFDNRFGAVLGSPVRKLGKFCVYPHAAWKGRVISAAGEAIDGRGALQNGSKAITVTGAPPAAMRRAALARRLSTGVKAVDVFTPLCYGQRIGVFAGSGVGKSTLLAMLAQSEAFDSAVISLVGERGREVTEFVEEVLGDSLAKSIVVVATGDESASKRRLAPLLATSLAEYFRDLGERVLLIMDSVTRFAHASRELALAAGEPPVARGFPPSIFGALPQLLERAGPGLEGSGSITGIYAVLVDGDNHNDPIADAIRGTLDGHIVLDRAIADAGRYPAIDILGSLSRLSHKCWTADEQLAVSEMRKLASRYEETRDLRALGGYQPGADAELDRALVFVPRLYAALNQRRGRSADSFAELARLLK